MKLDINNYPGSKNGAGVLAWLINHTPKSEVYYEIFGGSAVFSFELKKLVEKADVVVYEKSTDVHSQLSEKTKEYKGKNKRIVPTVCCFCGIKRVETLISQWRDLSDFFFYFDPPYLFESRSSKRPLYHHEWTMNDHLIFFELVKKLSDKGAKIMISHYPNDLYCRTFQDWFTSEMQTRTRTKTVTEKIWMNYDIAQLKLATAFYVGKDFTERQRIKRKIERLKNKISALPIHERQAVIDAMQTIDLAASIDK